MKEKKPGKCTYPAQHTPYFTGKLPWTDFQVEYFATVWNTRTQQLQEEKKLIKHLVNIVLTQNKKAFFFCFLCISTSKNFSLPLTWLNYLEYILIADKSFVIINGLDVKRALNIWMSEHRDLKIEQAMRQYLLRMTQAETEKQLSYCISSELNPPSMKSSIFLSCFNSGNVEYKLQLIWSQTALVIT